MEYIKKAYYTVFYERADQRVKNWLLMTSPWPLVTIIAVYLTIIKIVLPKFMRNRKPFTLRGIIKWYNVVQIFANAIVTWGIMTSGWTTTYHFGCMLPDYSMKPEPLRMLRFLWWTIILKILELLETVFFILRKKERQASFLHVYHHVSTLIIVWAAVKYIGDNWEMGQYLNMDSQAAPISLYDAIPNTQDVPNELPPPETVSRDNPPVATEPTVPTDTCIMLSEVSNNASENVVTPDVDPELLGALGAFEEETTEWGEPIIEQIAMRIKPLLSNGLKKEDKEALLKKYPLPKNVTLSKAPTLNAEVSVMLNESSRNRDKRLYNKQNQLGGALTAVTRAMSLLLCKDPKIVDILSILSDASKLVADSHYLETDTRRSLIIPMVDKELVEPFKDRKRDNYLFGDNLGDLVKNSRGLKKTGQLIQASTSSNLNYKAPSSRGRPQRNFANRAGGQSRPYRRPAPFPGPPPRRQLQAQYAPQRRRQPPTNHVAPTAPRNAPTTTDRAPAGSRT